MITFTGPMRLYFNRHGAAPLVWCVAADGWELAVTRLDVRVPIRRRVEHGEIAPWVAQRLNVSESTVRDVVSRRTWKDVP